MHLASLAGVISLVALACGGPIATELIGTSKATRNMAYEEQFDASWELNVISQPSTNPDLHLFRNYVYETNSGSKSWIYHVEYGVAYPEQADEFPSWQVDHSIITGRAQQLGYQEGEDYSPLGTFHSTCTADKALGQHFGVSKQSTLIPVVVPNTPTAYDLADAFEAIARDVTALPEKQKHSAVTMSLSVGPDREIADLERLHDAIQQVMDLDVAVVVHSGDSNGAAADEYPQAWADDNYPLIVVDSCDVSGAKVPNSPAGVRLSTYAVGQGIMCLGGASGVLLTGSHTSYAAPQVAGQIANWLSYDMPPIDLSPGRVARNIRDYLETNPSAGWVRPGGQRVLWNGVTEDFNPPFKKCAGLTANKYVEQATLKNAIEDDFCTQVPSQSFEKRYNPNTMEDMVLSIEYDGVMAPLDDTVNQAGCVRFLLGELTDGCDAAGNPNNWKGGGVATLTGVKYTITPMAERQPASAARLGVCQRGINGLEDNEYNIFGRGWLSSDAGQGFYQYLFDHCGLRLDSWGFNYYLDDDGREWSVRFTTDEEIPPNWVTEAGLQFGAPDDFDCDECMGSDCG